MAGNQPIPIPTPNGSKRDLVMGRVTEEYDRKHGFTWSWRDEVVDKDELTVWWEGNLLFIRQQAGESDPDLLIVDHGQAYDLLKVISRALEVN